MTQRRRTSKAKAKRRFGRRAFLTGAGVAVCAAAGWYLRQIVDYIAKNKDVLKDVD